MLTEAEPAFWRIHGFRLFAETGGEESEPYCIHPPADPVGDLVIRSAFAEAKWEIYSSAAVETSSEPSQTVDRITLSTDTCWPIENGFFEGGFEDDTYAPCPIRSYQANLETGLYEVAAISDVDIDRFYSCLAVSRDGNNVAFGRYTSSAPDFVPGSDLVWVYVKQDATYVKTSTHFPTFGSGRADVMAWSPDGARLFAYVAGTPRLLKLVAGDFVDMSSGLSGLPSDGPCMHIQYSGTGSYVSIVTEVPTGFGTYFHRLHVYAVSGDTFTPITSVDGAVSAFKYAHVWSANDDFIYTVQGMQVYSFDGATLTPETPTSSPPSGSTVWKPQLSSDGTKMVVQSAGYAPRSIWMYDVSGAALTPIDNMIPYGSSYRGACFAGGR